jgi:hypothetical protein
MLCTTGEQCTDWTSVWDVESAAHNKQTEKEGAQTLPKQDGVEWLYSH